MTVDLGFDFRLTRADSGNSAFFLLEMFPLADSKSRDIAVSVGVRGVKLNYFFYWARDTDKHSYYDWDNIYRGIYRELTNALCRKEKDYQAIYELYRKLIDALDLHDGGNYIFRDYERELETGNHFEESYYRERVYLGGKVGFLCIGEFEFGFLERTLSILLEFCSLPYEKLKRIYRVRRKEHVKSLTYRKEMDFLKAISPYSHDVVLFHRKRTSEGFTFLAQFPELDDVLHSALGFYRSITVSDGGNLVLPYSLEFRLTAKTRNYDKAIEILESFRIRLHEAISRGKEIEVKALS